MVIKNILSESVRTFGIFLWHERHRAGIHTACSCTSGATYAIATHVLLQLHFHS